MFLFSRLSSVRSLLCTRVQKKKFTFGKASGSQTLFQNAGVWLLFLEACKFLYPSVVVYTPVWPQPQLSFIVLLTGAASSSKSSKVDSCSDNRAGTPWKSHPAQSPCSSHFERSYNLLTPALCNQSLRYVISTF